MVFLINHTTNTLINFFFKFDFSVSYKFVDRGILETPGPAGLLIVVMRVSSNVREM